MARIYWDVLDCGGRTECCCRCPYLDIDNRREYPQQCRHPHLDRTIKGLKWNEQKRRSIECCETPEWCPLPKLIFPEGAKELISVSPIFRYDK